MPIQKYRAYAPIHPAGPPMALAGHRQGACLVQRRPARRQPGAHRADGRRAQEPHVRHARRDRFQGDRGGLSVRVADRFRFHPRELIESGAIPDDVTIQVLTQCARN